MIHIVIHIVMIDFRETIFLKEIGFVLIVNCYDFIFIYN